MPRYIKQQTAFVGGEQSPFLMGRSDIEQYKYGCQKLREVALLPQGGFVRRPGAKLIDKSADLSNPNKSFKLTEFSRQGDIKYLLIFSDGKLDFYRGDARVHTLLNSSFTESVIDEIDTAQLADTMIITHKSFAPKELRYNGADNNWVLQDIPLVNIPEFFFNDARSPAGKPEIQRIEMYKTDPGSVFTLVLAGYETEDISISSSNAETAANIQKALLELTITPVSGITCVKLNDSVNDPQFRVTFDGEAADDWPIMSGGFKSFTHNEDDYIRVFIEQEGESRKEPVWSAARGWPVCCAFFENRLTFGGSAEKPQDIWASRTGDFYNFQEGEGEPAEAINKTIASNKNNEVVWLVSSRELQVLTANSEHYNPYPFTPAETGFPMQTSNGSKKVEPQTLGGATYFIQRRGKGVRQFLYTDSESAYATENAALLSEHLIVDVIDTAQTQSIETDADYLYCLNNDGTIAVMNVLRGQNIQAWSMWQSQAGQFWRIGNVEELLYCVIKCADGFYVCRFDSNTAMDMAQNFTDQQQVTLGYQTAYTGKQVRAVIDGMNGDEHNPENVIDFGNTYNKIEVGVNFVPVCVPNYISDNVTNGSNRNRSKRPVRVWVELTNAVGVDLVYGGRSYDIAYRHMPLTFGDVSPKPFTGTKEKRLLGYSKDTAIEIRQTLPFARTAILSLTMEIRTV